MRRFKAPLLVIVLLGAAALMQQPLRRIAFTVFRLPLVVLDSLLSTLVQLPHLPHLVHENVVLRNELTARQLELVRLRETVRHLTRATQLTRTFQGTSGPAASIIGRTVIPTQHTIILDKGSRDGIVRDGLLLDVDGLVGRVVEVHPRSSFAMLLTDPNSRIACLVERSRESGLLVGTGEPLCQFIYLDLEADLVEGDRIVTAGLGGPVPKGVLVGTVVKIIRDERKAQTAAWIRPSVKLNQLEEVVCLPPSQQSSVERP